ncbi:MAG: hypothetical protein GY875_06020 [Gammaproteobacteria bacterium]|nr:hypothetical protein [Gammaproteobacteria bacterium]
MHDNDDAANNVTAVTSENGDWFAQRRADAANWIIPEGVLNLDLAVSGLMHFEEKHEIRQ